jgi:hypothetical protein
MPAALAYGVYISQPIRYSRACAQYWVFLDRAQTLTQKLLKQGYVARQIQLSLQRIYGRQHDLGDNYEISISKMKMDLFPFT